MSKLTLIASNMTFSFNKDAFFEIERCPTYEDMASSGVKVSDLIITDGETISIIEAKSSAPQPGNGKDFDRYISEITEKFINSLFLLTGLKIKRPYTRLSDLPPLLNALSLSNVKIRILLIIHGHKEEWLPPINDALNRTFSAIRKCFIIDTVKVINDTLAKQYKFIC